MAKQENGLARTLAAFDRLAVKPREAVIKALVTSASEVAAGQRALAPVDEGDLRDSIAVTIPGHSTPPYSQPGGSRVAGPNEIIVTAGNTNVRYPHHVEHGTSKMEAQPFFWVIVRLLRARIQKRIDRAGKKAIRDSWAGK